MTIVASAALLLPDTFPGPARRLLLGLALSLMAHVLLLAALRPMKSDYERIPLPAPLQVEISPAAPEPGALLGGAIPSVIAMDAGPLPAPAEAAPAERAARKTTVAPVTGLDLRIPLDEYYSAREVDVRAEPLNDPPLLYPQRAYQMRVRGKVTLRILINERGGVDEVTALESDPRGVFEEAALEAARALQFSPALRFGRAVKSQKTVEVAFDPYQSIHVP